MTQQNNLLDKIFPDMHWYTKVVQPLDGKVLLQVQYEDNRRGAIIVTDDFQEKEQLHRTMCKIVGIGEHAGYSKTTGRQWIKLAIGDYVLIPSMQGRRMRVVHPDNHDQLIHFVLCDDADIELRINNPETFYNTLKSN